jgi:filamentous hemagglutinin family protein
MNQQLFRLVFNKARGLLMAVAESAASHSRSDGSTRRRKLMFECEDDCFALRPAGLAIALFVTGTVGLAPYAQAQIIGDPAAAANLRPLVSAASNAVPLVQIQAPSAAGVSRNVYSQFDVQNNGVILNNARSNAQSQLGGWIQGNANLAAGTARVILNEVNSSDPSALRGYVEVAGDRAQVVIANPAGITCDGCGFINAARATLTTGTPLINGGSLDGFRVERGQILIQGAGMDASQADYTDLIARSVKINASLWASSLKITAGANLVNVDNSQASSIGGSGTTPAYAIDVAQLGGMYAGKIHLIGTEAGVGMRNAGSLGASAGEVTISIDGQLINSGRIGAQGNVSVNASSLHNAGAQIQAMGAISLNLGSGKLDNSGGLLRSNGALTVSADSISNRNTQGSDQGIEGQSISLTARSIDNTQGALRADQTISIQSSGALDNTLGQIASNQSISIIDIAATPRLVVTNTGGTLLAGQNLSINVGTLSGDGNLYSLSNLSLRLNSDFTNSGRIIANNDLGISTTGRLSNQSAIQAGNTLTLTAADLDNTGTGEISANASYLGVSGTLNNRGLIDGSLTRLFVGTLNNLGSGRIYGDNLAISVTTLNNDAEGGSAPVIAARGRLDIGAGTINNSEHALLFSSGDMAIGAVLDSNSRASGQANTLNNSSASIEALGNLDIAARQINNTNAHFSTTEESTGVSITEYQGNGSANRYLAGTPDIYIFNNESDYLHTPEGNYETWYAFRYTRTTSDTRILTTDPGQILSGGAMNLSGDSLLNDKSRIIAGSALNATLGNLNNTDVSGEHKVTDAGSITSYWRERYCSEDILGFCVSHDYRTGASGSAYAPAPTIQATSLAPTTYQQNTAPSGSGTQIAALSTASVGSIPSAALPNNALFHQNPSPSASYLIESDPRFANYRTWVSSDYMLQQLSIDPTTSQKRLGDGFYEQKLLREEVAQLTGRRFLEGYTSDEAEYRALMDQGVTQAKAWKLIPGVALSAAQVAQLTSDIVWLIEREVTLADGSTQKVLAPQLYLAPRSGDLLPSGALLSADSLQLNLTGDLINSGSIAGRQLVSLAANNIKNLGGTIAADNVALTAQTDLTNQGGRIEAVSNLELQAGQDITVASTTRTQTTAQGSRTNIDRVAGLYVTGSSGTLTAIAGRDANFNGTEIDNAGNGATTLAAANNLNFGAVTESNRQNIVFDGRNHLNTASTGDTGSQIRTQGELALMAGNDITAQAVNIQSAGNVGLTAGNDVTLLAGQRTQTIDEATYHKSKGDGLFSTTRTTSSSFKSEQGDVIGSQLSGQNVSIQAQRDASFEAAQVSAQNKLAINAGDDINVIAAEQTFTSAQTQMESKTNTFGLGRSSLKETLDINQVHQVGSVLQGKEVVLVSGNNLNLSASRIEGTDTVALTATNQINILAATDLDERKEIREYKNNIFGIDTLLQPFKGTNGLQNSLGLVTPKSFVSPARAKDKIKGEESESSRTAVRSELLGGDITLQSGADTTLQAPIIKGNSLTVTAGVINGQAITPDAKIILEGVKESTTTNQTGSSHSFVWQSMAGQGGTNETLILPKIELGKPGESGNQTSPTLNASGGIVVDAASLPGTAFEANKTGGTGETSKPLATTVIDLKSQAQELAKQPGMAWLGDLTKRDDVDWQTIKLVQDTWSYKNSGLTPEGGIVVAIIVAILLQDWSGTTATAITGATEGVVYAATQAAILATASASATSLINNKGNISKTLKDMSSDETLKQIVISALSAGALQAVGGTSWMKQFSGTTITDKVVTGMTNAVVRASISTAVQGGSYIDNLTQSLLIGAVEGASAYGAGQIGELFSANSLSHSIAHALLGCASAAATGNDCKSGAVGAAVGEYFAEQMVLSGLTDQQIVNLSKLVAAASVMVTGGDANTAANAAQNAVVNNTLSAQKVRQASISSGGDQKTARLLLDLANRENIQKIYDCGILGTCIDIINELRGGIAELDRQSIANGGNLDPETIAQAYRLAALDLKLAYDQAEKNKNPEMQKQALSALLDFAPLIGNVKAAIEAASGKDAVTNKDLSTLERVFAGVGVILPAAGKGATLLTKVGEETVEVAVKAVQIEDALNAAAKGTTAANRVTTATVRETGFLVAAKTAEESTLINTIIKEGDQTGKLTERLTESVFQRSGYQSIDPDLLKYSGEKGLDGVFFKNGSLVVVVTDSKQLSSGGVNLSKGNIEGTGLQPQMTMDWVVQTVDKLTRTQDPAKIAVANKIMAAKESGNLQLAVTAVNKSSGQLVVVPLKR